MAQAIKHRSDQDPKNCWRLEDLFATDALWEETLHTLQKEIAAFSHWESTATASAKNLLQCLTENDSIAMRLDQATVYANMKRHQDSQNPQWQAMANQAQMVVIAYMEHTAFLPVVISALPEETLAAYQTEEPGLALYHHFFDDLLRKKTHVLSLPEEALLAKAEDIATAPDDIFSMINNADIRFGQIPDDSGAMVTLTKGNYTSFMESPNRTVRRTAFETLYDAYLKQKNTIAATYYASVKKDVFFARARKYDSCLAMALDDDHIPTQVYDTLIASVHKYLPLMHRYVALRKKILGLSELHMYDLYAPLASDADLFVDYPTAKKNVAKALSPLGETYVNALKHGMENGWIDVYENEGKRGGAYSWGAFGGHPYVLMNYADNINSMFTLAHEMGHALHSYFTWQKQPYLYSGHKIFVAEVASTCNEALLMAYLLKTTTDRTARIYLINYFLEQFKGTFFRQAMFAEFEHKAHTMVEQGQPLTCENLSAMYRQLNHQYFGDGIVLDDRIDFEWARIPHFYNAYYVYQYATGYTAAIALSQGILQGGAENVENYLRFLTRGCSAYSIDLLKDAGVDLTSQAPFDDAMAVFSNLLDQMEEMQKN